MAIHRTSGHERTRRRFAVPEGQGHKSAGDWVKLFYVASASGGVWKTINGGTTWEPIFDKQGAASIGDIAVAPSNPDILWVGTGENNNQRSSSWGDGVYKSENGGKTWTNMGLRKSEHIGRIIVHPTNPQIVFVASTGPLWGSGGDRGLFRTTDGGRTWKNVKNIDVHTGFTDVIFDPANPDVIYAAHHCSGSDGPGATSVADRAAASGKASMAAIPGRSSPRDCRMEMSDASDSMLADQTRTSSTL